VQRETGGQTLLKRTANALNDALGKDLTSREWGRALEELKQDLGLPGNHHGKILSDGSYLDEFGNVPGSLTDYLP
jgi:filamentous hemagglutinin